MNKGTASSKIDRTGIRGYALIAAACLFWALSGVLAKFLFSSRPLNPLLLVQFRLLTSFLILAAVLAARSPGDLIIRRRDVGFFLVYGSVGMAMVQLSYFTAIREGTVSTAIFLQYLAPAITAAYAVLWVRQKAPPGLVINLGLAMGGSALLLLGGGGLSTTPLGVLAGVSSAAFMSFYAIYGSKGVAMYSPPTVLVYALGVGAVFLLPLAKPWQVLALGWGPADWLFVLYMAVLGTLVPFSLFLSGLKQVEPVQATLTAMLEPVLATTGAWLLLGESLLPLQAAGGLLILTAVGRLQLSRQGRAPGPSSQQIRDGQEHRDQSV